MAKRTVSGAALTGTRWVGVVPGRPMLGRPTLGRPMLGRHGDVHAFAAAPDLEGQVVGGHLWRRLALLVRLLHAAGEQGKDVVGQHRDREAQQRRAGMAEAAQLAVQHAFQPSGHALDPPARAIQLGDLPGIDLARQVAPRPDRGLAFLGKGIQRDLDAPQRCLLALP